MDTQAVSNGDGGLSITFVPTGTARSGAKGPIRPRDSNSTSPRQRDSAKDQIIRTLIGRPSPARLSRGSQTQWWLAEVKLPGNESKPRIHILEDKINSCIETAKHDPNYHPERENSRTLTLRVLRSLAKDLETRDEKLPAEGFYRLLRDRIVRYAADISRQPVQKITRNTFKSAWAFAELVNEASVYPAIKPDDRSKLTVLEYLNMPENLMAVSDGAVRSKLAAMLADSIQKEKGEFVTKGYVPMPPEPQGSHPYIH